MAESFGIRTRIIPDSGDPEALGRPVDEGNPPEQDPGNGNITSHTFPESAGGK